MGSILPPVPQYHHQKAGLARYSLRYSELILIQTVKGTSYNKTEFWPNNLQKPRFLRSTGVSTMSVLTIFRVGGDILVIRFCERLQRADLQKLEKRNCPVRQCR